ncbi:MAG: DUF4932 domain-containing protein [Anaerolineales bacterium]|nr:DUF4932 domain-containing protein [Anaerolineales bacterium]
MPLLVRTDDRLRLTGCLLAASDWPEHEQNVKAYKAHRVAEAARKTFSPLRDHPAVTASRRLAGDGKGLPTLFAHALNDDWPGDLAAAVRDFAEVAKLTDFYAEHATDFEQAETDARNVLARADLAQFLADLLGAEQRAHVFVPNLLYPGRQPVAFGNAAEVVVTAPPPLAWGSSPPWRYSERPDEALAVIAEAFARYRFSASLPAELASQSEMLGVAAAVLFLREAEGPDAGDQLMVMQKKTRGLKQLPAVVAGLETLLAKRRAGRPVDLNQVISTLTAT